jgi:Domain of unknown function (DUF1707)/Cell wall-active antibiotics response 4TMS YvqF
MRISDADRQRVIDVLTTSCRDGRLTLDEFSERVSGAWAARTLSELSVQVADLPHPFGPDVAGAVVSSDRVPMGWADMMGGPPVRYPGASAPATRWTVGIMFGNARKGRWRLRRETNAIAIMGGCEFDLRRAEVEGPEVVINALAFMGGVDVIVPEGIAVELTGIGVMGAKEARIADVTILPGSPVVRVRAFALMGSVVVRSRSMDHKPRR